MDSIFVEISGDNGLVQVQDGNTANIFIFDEIGSWYGYSRNDLIRVFRGGNVKNVNVYINSPGGNLEQALAMYDLIRGSVGINTTAYLLGQCASAATVIASAAQRVVMSAQCLYLVHKPLLSVGGNADHLRENADMLDVWENALVGVYTRKTGMSEDGIRDILRQDVYINAQTALALGFVDEVVDSITIDWSIQAAMSSGMAWETSDYYNNVKDGDTRMDGAAAFRSSVYNCITSGILPLNTMPTNKEDTMNVYEFLTNALIKAGIVPDNKREAANNALEASGAVNQLVNAAVEKIQNNAGTHAPEAPAEKAAQPLTADDVFGAIDGMSDDQLSALREKLGFQATAEQEEGQQADNELEEVKNTVRELADKVASVVAQRGGTPARGNGVSDVQPQGETKARVGNAVQLQYMITALERGQVDPDTFKATMGMTIDEARESLKS